MKRSTSAFALALMLISPLSLAQSGLKLSVNGKSSSVSAIVINGQTYVPLSALTAAGASATTTSSSLSLTLPGSKVVATAPGTTGKGGANQLAALEGCIGETLFNGVWRFKVTNLSAATVEGVPGYLVAVEMRNGTQRPQYVYATGLSNTNDAYTLAAADGNTGIWRTNYTLNDFADRNVPQAGMYTYTFKFWPDSNTTPEQAKQLPTKFIMRINTQYVSKTDTPYSVPDPSFRVNLSCKK